LRFDDCLLCSDATFDKIHSKDQFRADFIEPKRALLGVYLLTFRLTTGSGSQTWGREGAQDQGGFGPGSSKPSFRSWCQKRSGSEKPLKNCCEKIKMSANKKSLFPMHPIWSTKHVGSRYKVLGSRKISSCWGGKVVVNRWPRDGSGVREQAWALHSQIHRCPRCFLFDFSASGGRCLPRGSPLLSSSSGGTRPMSHESASETDSSRDN
jgi:hypothetical protein